MLNRTYTKH